MMPSFARFATDSFLVPRHAADAVAVAAADADAAVALLAILLQLL